MSRSVVALGLAALLGCTPEPARPPAAPPPRASVPTPATTSAPMEILPADDYVARVVAPHRGKLLLVNFWATWCPPCIEEMPALGRVARRFADRGLVVELLTPESEGQTPEKVRAFLEKLGVTLRSRFVRAPDAERFFALVDKSWNGRLPHTLVYDAEGRLAARLAGQQTEASFAAAVEKLLARAPRGE